MIWPAVIFFGSALLSTTMILFKVLTRGSTLPASIRATMDWLIPALFAISVCLSPSVSRRERSLFRTRYVHMQLLIVIMQYQL